jgi:DNA replication protein DnaC
LAEENQIKSCCSSWQWDFHFLTANDQMSRTARQINAPPNRPDEEKPRPFSDFSSCSNVVLLGDPGAGKSRLFRETATAEGARVIKARLRAVITATIAELKLRVSEFVDKSKAARPTAPEWKTSSIAPAVV